MLTEGAGFKTDADLQELVFIGDVYNHSERFKPYADLLLNKPVFKNPFAKAIWAKTAEYYHKYGKVPTDPYIRGELFDEKLFEVLQTAIEFAADDDDRYKYLKNKCIDNIELTFLRDMLNTLDRRINLGGEAPDTAAAVKDMYQMLNTLSHLRTVEVQIESKTVNEAVGKWQQCDLPGQQSRMPIPIPGLEKYISGSPTKQINCVVSNYGGGKSTFLCQLAAGMAKHAPGLYVTLEMPADNIAFKIISAGTQGLVPVNAVFMRPGWAEGDVMFDGVTREMYDAVQRYVELPECKNIHLMDMPAATIGATAIANEIRRIKWDSGQDIKWVCIDYADLLITTAGRGISEDGFSYMIAVMSDIQAMCKEMDVVVWTASQTAKGVSTRLSDPRTFHPIRSKDLWGSDNKLQVGNIGLGLAIYRVPSKPRYGIGALSVLKDRFQIGSGAVDLIVRADFARSTFEVVGRADVHSSWSDIIMGYVGEVMYDPKITKLYSSNNASRKRKVFKDRSDTELL